ncbi:MAG: pyridoxamine 5'-phosphate oxidase family protein [Spirochaetales bacterium]|nr:pyridoxamine 5'-phosphate oxidase family protein [Spirochaetales bacterium]MBR5098205.1 pyridoxamine 5'-phosphate oxidase family protein [Spirochaetales bacterium]
MRRNDREVTDSRMIADIIGRCYCCRIGFNDEGEVYIVPLSFGFEKKDDTYFFYFHGAREGRKIDLISKNPNVGFEMDTGYKLNEGSSACKYSARFQSIIGNGIVEPVSSYEEKVHALSLIMEHNTGKGNWVFDRNMTDSVAVFRLTVTKLSCKQHQ